MALGVASGSCACSYDILVLVFFFAAPSCSFFTQLYRLQLAPAGEVLARELLLFIGGGGLLLLASHSPFNLPQPPPQQQQGEQPSRERSGEVLLRGVATAESIHLHVVGRRAKGVHLHKEARCAAVGPAAWPCLECMCQGVAA